MNVSTFKLADRMRQLIDSQTEKRGKFAHLEALTGIPAEGWKSFYYGRQRPNPDMIEAVARAWPEFAFWLTTGIDDFYSGHSAPPIPDGVKMPFRERSLAKDVFLKKIEYERWVQEGKPAEVIDGVNYSSEEVRQRFVAEISDLTSLRCSQEQDLLNIEEKNNIRRMDSPN